MTEDGASDRQSSGRWSLVRRWATRVAAFLGVVATILGIVQPTGLLESRPDPVTEAANRLTDYATARVVETARFSSRLVPSTTQGVVDFRTGRAMLTVSHVDGYVVQEYDNFPILYSRDVLPERTTWMARRLTNPLLRITADWTLGAVAGWSRDPSLIPSVLKRAGSVETVGKEIVLGIKTTHLIVELNIRRIPSALPVDQRPRVQALIRTMPGNPTITVGMWIDSRGLIRRLVDRVAVDGRYAGWTETTTDLYDFGVSVPDPPILPYSTSSALQTAALRLAEKHRFRFSYRVAGGLAASIWKYGATDPAMHRILVTTSEGKYAIQLYRVRHATYIRTLRPKRSVWHRVVGAPPTLSGLVNFGLASGYSANPAVIVDALGRTHHFVVRDDGRTREYEGYFDYRATLRSPVLRPADAATPTQRAELMGWAENDPVVRAAVWIDRRTQSVSRIQVKTSAFLGGATEDIRLTNFDQPILWPDPAVRN